VNYLGVQKSAWLTRLIVALTLVTLTIVVIASLFGGRADVHHLAPFPGAGVGGVLRAGGLLFFAFAGYARIATLGEEVRNPARTIPRAIPIALAITIAIYAVVAVTLLLAAGPQRLASTTAPITAAAKQAGLGQLEPLIQVGAALASLGALLALLTGVGRTTLAMARHQDLPKWLAAVHPRHQVPHHADIALASTVSILVLTTDLRGVIAFSSFGVLLYYGIANAAAFTQPSDQRRWPRGLQILGVAGCLLLTATLPWTSLLIGVGVLTVGLGARSLARRRRAR
jgi:basic amino acid/polyamine antiporter, APA family